MLTGSRAQGDTMERGWSAAEPESKRVIKAELTVADTKNQEGVVLVTL